MKLFLDTASLEQVLLWKDSGLIDGITTNPTLLSKEDGNLTDRIRALCDVLPNGEISVEVTEKGPEAVYKQAKAIAALSSVILVKIPCHRDYYEVIHRLAQEEIPLNITLVFSLAQALFMAKLGVRYVSPFIGRLEDIKQDGVGLIYEIRTVFDNYGLKTGILAASIRNEGHVRDAMLAGADAITVPVNLMESLSAHPLTDKGIELFDADWRKVNVRQFP